MRRMWARTLAAGGWVAIAAYLAGCGEIRRIEECNAFIQKIHAGSDVLKEFDRAKDIDAQVAKIEAFEKEIASAQVTIPELAAFVDEYRKFLADVAAYARDQKDSSKYDDLNRRSEELSKREREFVDRLNTYCRSG